MQIELFDIKDKQAIPKMPCYMIPELKKIIDTFPNEHTKIFWYIFGMTCYNGTNPYVNLSESAGEPNDIKESVILRDIAPHEFQPDDPIVQSAMNKCAKLYETPLLRLWRGGMNMLDEMGAKLSQPLTFGKEGNATDVRGIMKDMGAYREAIKGVESDLIEEQSRVRGNEYQRYDQKHGYTNTKPHDAGEENSVEAPKPRKREQDGNTNDQQTTEINDNM